MNIQSEIIKMFQKQKNIIFSKKDLKFIVQNISQSIFSSTGCCVWKNDVLEVNNNRRFIIFKHRGKFKALHYLIYNAFVDLTKKDDKIVYKCRHKNICLNINHMTCKNFYVKKNYCKISFKPYTLSFY